MEPFKGRGRERASAGFRLCRASKGRLITIKPAEFRAWLEETGLPDTAETRRRHVALRAVKHGPHVA